MSTESVLDEIRNRIDIVELVTEYVFLKKAGRNYKGLCPFHAEKTPSFMVNPEKQIFHCFGCNTGGDIFGFIMRQENLTFPEAKSMLAKRAGVKLRQEGARDRGMRDALQAIQGEALRFFRDSLGKSKEAMDYLNKRGISDASAEAFSLGYAPQGWHSLHDHLKRLRFKDEHIMQSGVVAKGQRGPYDIFRSRIVFPIFNIHGEPIAFGGRIMDKGEPKYLNSPDTPLFRKGENLYAMHMAKEEIRKKGYSILAEGYLDVIMCHQGGIANAVAPLGTALTGGHLRKLRRYSENLLLVFDGDQAGVAAAKRSLEMLFAEGLKAKVLLLPEGEDPDSLIRDSGAEGFKALLGSSVSPVDFMIKSSKARSKRDTIKDTIALISRTSEPLFRDEIIAELADRTGIRELTLREELQRLKKTGTASRTGGSPAVYTEETLLLSAALSNPEKTEEIINRVGVENFGDPLVRSIFSKLLASDGASPLGLAETDEENALITRLSVSPGFDPDNFDKNVEDCIGKIQKLRIKAEIKRIDEDIKAAERAKDQKMLNRLLTERQKLLKGAA
jgi:DNA primase